jgi:hypothetical protein
MVLRTAERITLECDQRHSSLFIAVDTEAESTQRLYLASHVSCDITHSQKHSQHKAESAVGRRIPATSGGSGLITKGRCGRNPLVFRGKLLATEHQRVASIQQH